MFCISQEIHPNSENNLLRIFSVLGIVENKILKIALMNILLIYLSNKTKPKHETLARKIQVIYDYHDEEYILLSKYYESEREYNLRELMVEEDIEQLVKKVLTAESGAKMTTEPSL